MDQNAVAGISDEVKVFLNLGDEYPVTCTLTYVYSEEQYESQIVAFEQDAECKRIEDQEPYEEVECQVANLQISKPSEDQCTDTQYYIVDEREAMAALGLPTAFGDKRKNNSNRKKARIGKDEFATFILPSLNENYEENYEVHTLETAKPIFAQMGYYYKNLVSQESQTFTDENERRMQETASDKPECIDPSKAQIEDNTIIDNNRSDAGITNIITSTKQMSNVAAVSSDSFIHARNSIEYVDAEFEQVKPANIESQPISNTNDDITIESDFQLGKSVDGSSSEYASAKSQLDDEENLGYQANLKVKSKKKSRKRKNKKIDGAIPDEILQDKVLIKYYLKRYTLFSLFDQGIKLDREGWFSATPECIAKHTANRLRCDIVVDGFCGTGGNAIQFAKTCNKVIAIDIDPNKIQMAKHNARIYDVANKIEFIVGDFIQLASKIKADAVFMSPPWGGPNYNQNTVYDIEEHLQPLPASSLIKIGRQITNNIAMYLPKKSNTQQLLVIAGPGGSVELEQNFLFGRLTAITAYYGNLIRNT